MKKNRFIFIILLAFAVIFFILFTTYKGGNELPELGNYYAQNAAEEVGAPNLVTAIIVTYRGLDTLGEVTVLFLTATIISLFLKIDKTLIDEEERKNSLRKTSEILQTASKIMIPITILFGAYVFINGHLTPGGGFQGGAIIATAVVLGILANPTLKISHNVIAFVESISGISFVIVGILGILLAGGFLDNRIFNSLGKFGTLLSAGAIPIIYSFVGLKVGAELSNILAHLKETQKEII